MSTTISLDFKTLATAVNATTGEPVGSDPWNQQFIRLFGEEAFKVERVGGPPPVGPELKATGAA